mmetsp:Transcript_11955/g.23719  ORF Transcript_11955/g.23719 Transcript_11955/m.23719 type:complete len:208 (+) Transcript_11955:29-652(+)|eukprot:CAMPEP_0171733266 /NCGR_PEP_ID=MMETSP0991-20121206/30156_1 /TAXON_ID=483369 /ORGANISM="non described non described, Strain CCMP2098" /LENGTH=207 /DNA_ID=CAMNT_0012328901 /DNA_START=13 /DNA_END=636 /DNA_ORIENTATION=-
MDESNFRPIDTVAYDKWVAISTRLNDLEPPEPPPSASELYRDMKEVHERIVRVKSRPKTSLPIAKSTPQNLASPNSEHNDTDLSEASSLTLLKARRTPIGDDEAHAWLEANGFEVDNLRRPLEPGKSTVWHLAVEDSNLPMLQWLYDNGAAEDIRRPDDASITPLQISSMKRDLAVTRWLFSHGAADVYKFNPYFGEGVAAQFKSDI